MLDLCLVTLLFFFSARISSNISKFLEKIAYQTIVFFPESSSHQNRINCILWMKKNKICYSTRRVFHSAALILYVECTYIVAAETALNEKTS